MLDITKIHLLIVQIYAAFSASKKPSPFMNSL